MRSSRVGVKVRTVTLPYPQAGVDVDKVEDMMLVESILAGEALSFKVGVRPKIGIRPHECLFAMKVVVVGCA